MEQYHEDGLGMQSARLFPSSVLVEGQNRSPNDRSYFSMLRGLLSRNQRRMTELQVILDRGISLTMRRRGFSF